MYKDLHIQIINFRLEFLWVGNQYTYYTGDKAVTELKYTTELE